jgi:hypothetical protein
MAVSDDPARLSVRAKQAEDRAESDAEDAESYAAYSIDLAASCLRRLRPSAAG